MELERDDVMMGDKLGDGASGDVFAATLEGQAVAVKVCRGRARSRVYGRHEAENQYVDGFHGPSCAGGVMVHLAVQVPCLLSLTISAFLGRYLSRT